MTKKTRSPDSHSHRYQSPLMSFLVALALLSSGALQTFSLAPYGFWLLGPISIVLILLTTRALNAQTSNFKGFYYGWLFGLGLFGSGASWVYVSINTYGYAPPFLAGSLTLLFVAGLALFPAISFFVYGRLKTSSKAGNALFFIACWVLGDLFRTYFLTGFPWLFLGYSHIDSPLSGWIPITGVFGLTAITVASGIALYFLSSLIFKALPLIIKGNKLRYKRKYRSHYHPKKTIFKITFIILTAGFWISGPTLNKLEWTTPLDKQLSVALLQTNIPQEEKWKPAQRAKTLKLLENMTNESWNADLIIWPETAIPLLYDRALPFLENMNKQAKQENTNIISGIPFREIDKTTKSQTLHNSIVSIGQGEGLYHKQKLVPFGEYVPLQDLLRGLIAFFDLPMSDFRTGSSDQAPLSSFNYTVSPFICYEVVYPDFVRNNIKNSEFLLTISNDSWFGASIGPLQHLEMAQMRAAENGRYMIRGTNNGISAVINQKGHIIDQSEQFVRTTLNSTIHLLKGETPFNRYGSWPIGLLSLFIVLFFIFERIRYHKLSSK